MTRTTVVADPPRDRLTRIGSRGTADPELPPQTRCIRDRLTTMLRRNQSHRSCHFCNNVVLTAHGGDFQCPTCGSWNTFDASGRIKSYHPAMQDEALNTDSFSKRASPNKSRLPSSFSTNVFCHTCQTNQTLIMNLLSNYLPASSDPTYSKRLAEFPAYKESLYARYPPVCARCQPSVDEQIQQKDDMARSSALGGWLQASRRRSLSPGVRSKALGEQTPSTIARQTIAWNVRGLLWLGMTLWWIYSGIAGALRYPQPPPLLPYPSLAISLASILWQFWDPTWKSLQRTRLQGHEARVEGRTAWLRYQGLIWVARLARVVIIDFRLMSLSRSALAAFTSLELVIDFIAFRSIRIVRPPRVRLVASSRPRNHTPQPDAVPHNTAFQAPPVPPPAEVPPLSALSLSSFPTSRPSRTINPIFGVTSLPQSQPLSQPQSYANSSAPDASDAMDWSPATGSYQEPVELLRPARFAPEKPTGLEGLIEKFGIGGDEPEARDTNNPRQVSREESALGKGMFFGVMAGMGLVVGAALVVFWPQLLASQQGTEQVLTPQHIVDDL